MRKMKLLGGKARVFTAFITALSLVTSMVGDGFFAFPSVAATGETTHIDGMEWNSAIDLYDAGLVRDFTLDSDNVLNVNDPYSEDDRFTVHFNIPASVLAGSVVFGPELYLLPVTSEDPEEAFIKNYKLEHSAEQNDLYPINFGQKSVVTGNGSVDFTTDDAYFQYHEYFYVDDDLNDVYDIYSTVPPTGTYYIACMMYHTDMVSFDGDTAPASFIIGGDTVYIDNPADLGGPEDTLISGNEEQGELIDLDIKVYAGDTEVTCADTIVYGSNGVCYGFAPCKAHVGENITVTIRPTGWCEDLKYDYDFPQTRKGNELKITVPDDGQIVVNLPAHKKDITLSGYVYDENGDPLPGATVSAFSGGYTSTSFTGISDITGFYRIEGITASTGLNASASKKGCIPSIKSMDGSDITDGAELNADFDLKYKSEGFTVRITSDADPELIFEVTSLLENGTWSEVTDDAGKITNGDFVMTAYDTLVFYPDTEEDISDSYDLIIKSSYIKTESTKVSYGGVVELELKNLSGVKMYVPEGETAGKYLHLCGFGASGDICFSNSGKDRYVLKLFEIPQEEETMDIIGFSSDSKVGVRALSIGEIPDIIKTEAFNTKAEISAGSITDLGDVELPFIAGRSRILDDSYVSATSSVQKEGDTIKVTGHIGSAGNDCTVKALRVYGWSPASTEYTALIMAGYKENSLVINGAVAGAKLASSGEEYWNMGRLITFDEPVTGAFDFSCSLEVFEPASMIVIVEAEGTDRDGKEFKNELIGECPVSGIPVSLKTSARTAGGSIKCSGIGAPGSTVYIYSGDALVGTATADDYGTWETRVSIPITKKSMTSVRLHASCNGSRTGECIVIYDPGHAAAEEIYLTSGIDALPNTYTWAADSVFAAEAVVGNPEAMGDSGTFYIMCSDGTVISLEAKAGEQIKSVGNVNRQIFRSDTYDFGAKNLVPTKIWFTFDRGSMPEKTEGREYLYSAVSENSKVKEEQPKSNHFEGFDKILDEEDAEAKFAITTVAEEVTLEEMEKLLKEDANRFTFYGDEGKDLYEVVTSIDEEKYSFGIKDISEEKYYIYDMYIYDGTNVPVEVERTLSQKADDGAVIVTDYISASRCNSVVDIAKDLDDTAGVISLLIDPSGHTDLSLNAGLSALLAMDPKTAKLAPILKKVGISELTTVWQNAGNAMETWSKSKEMAEDIKFLDFMDKYGNLLSENADTTRSLSSIRQARRDLDRAITEQKKYMAESFALSVIDYALGKLPNALVKGIMIPLGKIKDAILEATKAMGSDTTWAMAQENVTEAKLQFLKMSSLSNEELMGLFNDAERGVITDEYVMKILLESIEGKDEDDSDDGEEEEPGLEEPGEEEGPAESEDSENLNPIIDPSGYVYEAVASNRTKGAVVTLYSEGMEPFDGGRYGQSNPLITDGEGKYAWDVPEGNWFVKAYDPASGEGTSQNDPAATVTIGDINYLPVLPPQLDVNIPLTSAEAPKALICISNDRYYLVFDKYVQLDTVSDGVVFNDPFKDKAQILPVDSEVSPAHTPVCGGMELASVFEIRFTDDAELTDRNSVSAQISESVLGYNGISAEQTALFDAEYVPSKVFGVAEGDTSSAGDNTGDDKNDANGSNGGIGGPKGDGTKKIPVIPFAAGGAGLLAAGGAVAAVLIRRKKKK